MNKLFLSLLLIILPFIGISQSTIKGTILDAETEQPIPYASVYVNGSTIGKIADESGQFELTLPAGNFELVASFTGYQSLVYGISSDNTPSKITFKLVPLAMDLDEVVVDSKRDKAWYDNLKVFETFFLGETSFSKDCEILNKERLIMDFDPATSILKVMSNEPIKIENKALGYNIEYLLADFTYNGREGRVSFIGYPFFREMEGNKRQERRWEENRKEAYLGSFTHFLKTLIEDKNLEDEGYIVRKVIRKEVEEPRKAGGISISSQENQSVRVTPTSRKRMQDQLIIDKLSPADFFIANNGEYALNFDDILQVQYNLQYEEQEYLLSTGQTSRKRAPRTTLLLLQGDSAIIDSNGIPINPLDIFFEGYWGWEKTGNLLPLDYSLEN
ncbi:carboxypeptidase-like regulatory domain-containing protein [Fulvivirgaceae bacterium LMO-SS25]